MKVSHDSDSWHASGIIRRDFRNGYHPEDEDDTRSRSKGKGKKICKRSKDGQHDWTGKRTGMAWNRWTEYPVDENGRCLRNEDGSFVKEEKRGYQEKTYIVCAKCSKPHSYMWRWSL